GPIGHGPVSPIGQRKAATSLVQADQALGAVAGADADLGRADADHASESQRAIVAAWVGLTGERMLGRQDRLLVAAEQQERQKYRSRAETHVDLLSPRALRAKPPERNP